MTSTTIKTGAVAAAVLMALTIATPAMAQGQARSAPEDSNRATELGAITVVAPRIVYKEVRRVKGSVIPKEITMIQKTVEVRYSDLDLMRPTDQYVLEERVGRAAQGVCEQLATEVPDGEPDTAICARHAIRDAMAQIRAEHPTMASAP
jgi:UrcA family protein